MKLPNVARFSAIDGHGAVVQIVEFPIESIYTKRKQFRRFVQKYIDAWLRQGYKVMREDVVKKPKPTVKVEVLRSHLKDSNGEPYYALAIDDMRHGPDAGPWTVIHTFRIDALSLKDSAKFAINREYGNAIK